jgi:ankyrin repeat protein
MKYLKLFKESVGGSEELIRATQKGDVRKVERLISSGVNLDIRDNLGWTALIWASYLNWVEVVKFLIEAGANLNIRSNGGKTALMWASCQNHVELVKLLLENFADESILDNGGWSFYDHLNDRNREIIKRLYPNEVENAINFSRK